MGITERIDNITELRGHQLSVTPPIPSSVKLELTSRCDHRCYFCAHRKHPRPKQDMDRALFSRILPEMREAGVVELGLFYIGESFMCSWLADAVSYAKKDCGFPYVFLTTNGRLAVPSRVEPVMAAGLDSLKFSLNHADPKQYYDVTGLPPFNFEVILKNVELARRTRDAVQERTGHRCGLYASSIQYDGEQGERMKELIATRIAPYVDQHYFLPLFGQGGQVHDDLGERGLHQVQGNPGRAGAMRKPLPCWAVFNEGHITFDGKLSLCCFTGDDRWNAGDLNEVSFKEAWHSQIAQDLRKAHLAGDVTGTVCEKCME